MNKRPKLNYAWRPETYWPTDHMKDVRLGRVKGTVRRQMVEEALQQGEQVLEERIADESLHPNDLSHWGRIHPAFMGGEFLPDLDPGQDEVEIARIELESVTADVISLRARRDGGRIHYRMVDEYDTSYTVQPEHTNEPLTLGEVITLIETAASDSYVPDAKNTFVDAMRNHQLDAMEPQEAVEFISLYSRVYLDLDDYFAAQAQQWARRVTEQMRSGN